MGTSSRSDESKSASTAGRLTQGRENRKEGKQRWLRRVLLGFVALALVLIVFRIVLAFALPAILSTLIFGDHGTIGCARCDFSLFTGKLEMGQFELVAAGAEEPFIQADSVLVDLSVKDLIQGGNLVISRLEADGLELIIDREADGTVSSFGGKSQDGAEEVSGMGEVPGAAPAPGIEVSGTAVVRESAPARIPDLVFPVEIESFRSPNARVRFRDRSVEPPLDAHFDLNLRVSNLGSLTRQTRIHLELSSTGMLDALGIDATGRINRDSIQAQLQCSTGRCRPETGAAYLELLGIRPAAESLSLGFKAEIEAGAGEPGTDGLKARLTVKGLQVSSDGEEALGLDHLRLEFEEAAGGVLKLVAGNLEKGRTQMIRDADGIMAFAGLAFPGLPDPAKTDGSAEGEPETSWAPWRRANHPVNALKDLALNDLRFRYRDESVDPSADLSFELKSFSFKNPAGEAARKTNPARIKARLSAPGIVEDITMKGEGRPGAPEPSIDLTLTAEGIHPEALAPYLERIRTESLLKKGKLSLQLHAGIASGGDGSSKIEFVLTDLELSDELEPAEDEVLFALGRLNASGVEADPDRARYAMDTFEVSGIRTRVRRHASGAVELLGLRFKGIGPSRSERIAPSVARAGRAPRIEVGRLAIQDTKVQIVDQAAGPERKLLLAEAGVEINNFNLDLDLKNTLSESAEINAWLKAPGLAEQLQIKGSLHPRTEKHGAAAMILDVTAEGLTDRMLAPYLERAGEEPYLEQGRLHLHIEGNLAAANDRLTGSCSVRNLLLEDRGRELLGLSSARLVEASFESRGLEAKALEIEEPRFSVERDEDGTFRVAGIELPAGQDRGFTREPAAKEEPFSLRFDRLHVKGAGVKWTDRAVDPAVNTTALLDVELGAFAPGREVGSSDLRIDLQVPGSLERLALKGKVAHGLKALDGLVEIEGQGLRSGPLAAYLPAGLASRLKDGRLRGKVKADFSSHAAGGWQGLLALSEIDLRDGADGPPQLKMDALKVQVERLDMEAEVLAFDEVSMAGLETAIEKTEQGLFELPGFLFDPLAAAAPPLTGPSLRPHAPEKLSSIYGPPAPLPDMLDRLSESLNRNPPLITLKKLDLDLERFSYRDRTRPDEGQAVVAELRLRNQEPIRLLGRIPQDCPPVKLEIRGKAPPLAAGVDMTVEGAPFAEEPHLVLDLDVKGITGEGLAAMLPGGVDPSPLKDGRFTGRMETRLLLDRLSPVELDLSRPFGLDLYLEDCLLREGTDGKVLAGVEAIYLESAMVDPAAGKMYLPSVEVRKPTGCFSREEDGLHGLGMVFKTPPAEKTVAGTGGAEAGETSSPPEPIVVSKRGKDAGGSDPGPDILVKRLTASEIDFTYQDMTASPPMVVPLTGLDLILRGLTNRAFLEHHPVYFEAYLESGDVSIHETQDRGVIMGALEGAYNTVTGGKDEPQTQVQNRRFFQAITASGTLALKPVTSGRLQAEINALELTGFKGPANKRGITLNKGVMDAQIDLKFHDDGSLDTSSRFLFTDLSVQEPKNGFLERYLRLPVSLDTVIFLLRDRRGTVEIPLHFHVGAEGMSPAKVFTEATTTLGILISKALAKSPLRIAGESLDLVGSIGEALHLISGDEEKKQEGPVTLRYGPGEILLPAGEVAGLESVLKRLEDEDNLVVTLSHEVGGGDIALFRKRVNPSPEDCLELAKRFRKRKLEILAAREAAVSEAGEAITSGIEEAGRSERERLRAIEEELAQMEQALDTVLELLQPGSNRLVDRRTRNACLDIARVRLKEVQRHILDEGPPNMKKRIHVRQPWYRAREGQEGGRLILTLQTRDR